MCFAVARVLWDVARALLYGLLMCFAVARVFWEVPRALLYGS